jgi:hypothetical protein
MSCENIELQEIGITITVLVKSNVKTDFQLNWDKVLPFSA